MANLDEKLREKEKKVLSMIDREGALKALNAELKAQLDDKMMDE